MRILLSNDDGVNAPGLRVLAKSLEKLGHIKVVAPDRDRSAASHSLTIDAPLRMTELENGFVAINGTPTDCVHLAIRGYLKEAPDMVVSGINSGSNLGDDVLYSGTVAAAIEGRFLGYPTIAVSLAGVEGGELTHYETAGWYIARIVSELFANPLHKDVILNVNVPDLPLEQTKGIQVTRLGLRHLAEGVLTTKDPRGKVVYWVAPAGPGSDAGPGTDFYAIQQGYVSVTPLKTDLTDKQQLPILEEWFSMLKLNR
ncbi:MAG TPA: 5'/3'-nucleotidase SurE [Gammaproteobacteria bacterium]|nr:5'/3'-nucleotidase SurE [Gammaproteobacteria bacterium]